MQYSDIKQAEQLKIALLEQNGKVISHLEKTFDAYQGECFLTVVPKSWLKQLLLMFDEDAKKISIMCCQRIKKRMVQSNKKNEEAPNEDQTVNYWPNAYSKNVHKKLVEID